MEVPVLYKRQGRGVRGTYGKVDEGYIRRRWWRTWWEGEREEEERVQSRAPRDVTGAGLRQG